MMNKFYLLFTDVSKSQNDMRITTVINSIMTILYKI